MDDNTMLGFLPVEEPQGENLLAPMPADERAIQNMVGIPDAPTERLRTRMNPEGGAARDRMTFGENVKGAFTSGSVIGARIEAGANEAAATGGANLANRGFTPDQLKQLPTRVREQIKAQEDALTPEAKAKRLDDSLERVFEQAAFDLSQSNFTVQSVPGAIVGTIVAPENFIAMPARATAALGRVIASKLPSASPAITRAIQAGANGAFGNIVTDPVVQAQRMASGGQDGYDPAQTALAGVTGLAAGVALSGAASGISKGFEALRGKADAPAEILPGVRVESPIVEPKKFGETVSPEVRAAETPAEAPAVARGGNEAVAPTVAARTPNSAPEPSIAARVAPEEMKVAALARDAAPDRAVSAPDGVQPMGRGQGVQGVDVVFDRQVLAGEQTKPRVMPENATPDDIASFRVTQAIDDLAARIGRKVEVDGRFTARNAAGEYKLKDGVIRIRQMGDFETFAHEAGHAIDQDLRRTVPAEWKQIVKAHEADLKKLDANTSDPAKQTADEGVAEFLRAYVTNPAYARNQLPSFADAFDRLVQDKNPKLAQWLDEARRVSDIDSGLPPTKQIESQIVDTVDQGIVKEFRATTKREGLGVAFRDTWDKFLENVVTGKNQPVYRFVEELKEAVFQKTGQARGKEFTWDDPYKRHRMLPGAEQAALRQLWDGVADYHDPGLRTSRSLHDSIALAIGRPEKIGDASDPAVKAFNGYLIVRRAAALYERFNAGELKNRPIRMSERNVLQAIADYEAANPQFRIAADGVFEWNRAYLTRKRDAGLIPQDIYESIIGKNGDYVPFMRDVSDLKSGGGNPRDSSLEKGAAGKRIQGSTRDILDPLQVMFSDAIRTERLIARNDFVKSLYVLAQQAGEFGGRFVERIKNSEFKATSVDLAEAFRAKAKELGLDRLDTETMIREMEDMIGDDLTATLFRATEITPKGERIMFFWDGGERVALKVGHDRYSSALFETMVQMGNAERDIFMKLIGTANTYFTQFITNAPQFALKNLVMDNLSRIFIARNTGALGRIPFGSIAQGIYTTLFDKEFAKAYEAQGGLRGGVAASAVREFNRAKGFGGFAEKPADTVLGKVIQAGQSFVYYATKPRTIGEAAKDAATLPIDSVRHLVTTVGRIVESTETIGRVGQAKIVYNHLRKQGLTDAEAMRGALFEARDILDYDQFGASTTMARRFMPFLNVAFQGTSRANQNLFGDPARAIAQWNARGRDWSKVDADLQAALKDGIANWGMIASFMALTAGYHAWASEQDVYQKASPYMKRRYWIFPLPGTDAKGDQNYFTIPKPFDLPGALISAFEATLEWRRTGDPEGHERVKTALKDGFVPRQLESLNALTSANPFVKLGAELATGRTIPFEDGKPFNIVPQSVASLPDGQQYTGRTSYMAKTLGGALNYSPMKVDHIINGLGATVGRDVNDVLTAAFDKNPNMTPQDAFTKLFFGGLYRRQRGVGAPGNALREAMGQDGGKYVVAANGYRLFVETGDRTNAEKVYNAADNIGKTVMTLRGHSFVPAERQLHPLERAEAMASITSSISRDLSANRVQIQDRSRKRGEEREFINVDPQTARGLMTAINAMAAEDIVSGLKIAGVPGYQNAKVINGAERLAYIRALSPEVADEIEKRIEKAHIIPIDRVEKNWPEVQRRLLQDKEAARFKDLLPGVKLPKSRR